MGFSSEFTDKPYNEHPVTIYPGPNIQYSKQLHSPTYTLQKLSPPNTKSSEKKASMKRDSRSDGEMLSPKGKLPPRTLAGSMERHREVCRGSSEDVVVHGKRRSSSKSNDEEHFSDDSLEDAFPPPPPVVTTPSKRNSIAWEVSLDGDDPLLTPGSTKVSFDRYDQKKRLVLIFLETINTCVLIHYTDLLLNYTTIRPTYLGGSEHRLCELWCMYTQRNQ